MVRPRLNGKKELVKLYSLLRSRDITAENEKQIREKIELVERSMEGFDPEVPELEEVMERREILSENAGLYDIFTTLWFCLNPMTDSFGVLTLAGYVKFHLLLSKCLGRLYSGLDEESALQAAESDYAHDKEVYGELNRFAFNDSLFLTIELYTEFIDPQYYAAFAWTILDCLADVSKNPPRFRPIREVRCIMRSNNEAAMVTNYLSNDTKGSMINLQIMNRWMMRVPDVQKRVATRRGAGELDESMVEDIQRLSKSMSASKSLIDSNAGTGNNTDTEEDEPGSARLTDEGDSVSEGFAADSDEEDEDSKRLEETLLDDLTDAQLAERYEQKTVSYESYFKPKSTNKAGGQWKGGGGRTNWLNGQYDYDLPDQEFKLVDGVKTHVPNTQFGRWVGGGEGKKDSNGRDVFLGGGWNEGGEGYTHDPVVQLAHKGKRHKTIAGTTGLGDKLKDDTAASLARQMRPVEFKKTEKKTANRSARRGSLLTNTSHFPDIVKRAPVEVVVIVEEEFVDPGIIRDGDKQVGVTFAEEGGVQDQVQVQDKEEGLFKDNEWRAFQLILAQRNEHDAAVRKRVEAERAVKEADAAKQREDAMIMANARQEAIAAEEERKRMEEDMEIAKAQASLDAMLSDVDMTEEITDDMTSLAEEGSVRSHRSLLRGADEKVGEPRFEQTSAVDGVQFDPSDQELYEMDSIFSDLSSDASICTDDHSKRAFENAVIGAALSRAAQENKVKIKAEKARHRVQKMQLAIEEYEKGLENQAQNTKNAENTQQMLSARSHISMTSVMTMDTIASIGAASQLPPSLAAAGIAIDNGWDGVVSLDGAGIGIGVGVGDDDMGMRTRFELFERSDSHAEYTREGGDIINAYRSGNMKSGDDVPDQAQMPFPHNAFNAIAGQLSQSSPGPDGWGHQRAVRMQLLKRLDSFTKEDVESFKQAIRDKEALALASTQANESGESLVDKLKIKPKELPWFKNEVKHIRGISYGQPSLTLVPQPQKALVQPGDIRFIKGLAVERSTDGYINVGRPLISAGAGLSPPTPNFNVAPRTAEDTPVVTPNPDATTGTGTDTSGTKADSGTEEAGEGKEKKRVSLRVENPLDGGVPTNTNYYGNNGNGADDKNPKETASLAGLSTEAATTVIIQPENENEKDKEGHYQAPLPLTAYASNPSTPAADAERNDRIEKETNRRTLGLEVEGSPLKVEGSPEKLEADAGKGATGGDSAIKAQSLRRTHSIVTDAFLSPKHQTASNSPTAYQQNSPFSGLTATFDWDNQEYGYELKDRDEGRAYTPATLARHSLKKTNTIIAKMIAGAEPISSGADNAGESPTGPEKLGRGSSSSSFNPTGSPYNVLLKYFPKDEPEIHPNRARVLPALVVCDPESGTERVQNEDPGAGPVSALSPLNRHPPKKVWDPKTGWKDKEASPTSLRYDRSLASRNGNGDGSGSLNKLTDNLQTDSLIQREAPAPGERLMSDSLAGGSLSLSLDGSLNGVTLESSFHDGHNVKRGREQRRLKEQERQAYFAMTRERMGPLMSSSLSVRNLRKVPLPAPLSVAGPTSGSHGVAGVGEEQSVHSLQSTDLSLAKSVKSNSRPEVEPIVITSNAHTHMGVAVLRIERHMNALEEAPADPVGPATRLGVAAIEEHPRFKYTGFPAPSASPPKLYTSSSQALDVQKSSGVTLRTTLVAEAPYANRNDNSFPSSASATGITLGEKKQKFCLGKYSDAGKISNVTGHDFQPPFWLPGKTVSCLNDPMYHDRSSHLNGWDDLKHTLVNRVPNEFGTRANVVMSVKRQEAFLERFKDYVTTTEARDSNPEFMHIVHKGQPAVPTGKMFKVNRWADKFTAQVEKRKQVHDKYTNLIQKK